MDMRLNWNLMSKFSPVQRIVSNSSLDKPSKLNVSYDMPCDVMWRDVTWRDFMNVSLYNMPIDMMVLMKCYV